MVSEPEVNPAAISIGAKSPMRSLGVAEGSRLRVCGRVTGNPELSAQWRHRRPAWGGDLTVPVPRKVRSRTVEMNHRNSGLQCTGGHISGVHALYTCDVNLALLALLRACGISKLLIIKDARRLSGYQVRGFNLPNILAWKSFDVSVCYFGEAVET
jgi:hypothetical protein